MYKSKFGIFTILFTILALALLGKPLSGFVKKLKGSEDWKAVLKETWDQIVLYSKKAGRSATREVLKVYYAITGDTLPIEDRIILLAGITYIIIPGDFVPIRKFGILGILDDAAVFAYIENKLKKCMTPELNEKVESTLTKWFGNEIVTEPIIPGA